MWRFFVSRDSYFGLGGLRNYSQSCCVNAVLQTLAATEELSHLLEKWDPPGPPTTTGSNVPLKLKRVLAAMRSGRSTPDPHRDFLHCLHRNGLRLNVQHDADEAFLAILGLLKQQMEDGALAQQIQNLYRTSVETRVECLECTSVQSQSSFLLSFPLHLKEQHNSLDEGLTSFFQQQELSGANSCFCPPCGRRTSSKQALRLLALPPVLCVQLKRFRSRGGFTFKLGCTVTFPQTLDFSQTLEDASVADGGQNQYRLYAVVVHSGSAEWGHYTAYVHVNHSWFYADDNHTRQSSWEEVQTSYGGNHRGTAYMLMYRRFLKEEQTSGV